jgi:hypothetical protein
MAKTKAKTTNRDSYAGIPQSAHAEIAKKLASFRTIASPQTVYQVMQETAKRKEKEEEVEKAQDLQKREKEKRAKLSEEGRTEIRAALARVYARMSDISLHVGLLKAGADDALPLGHIDENDLQGFCARSADAAMNTLYEDMTDLQNLFDLGDEPLGDEIRAAKMEAEHV